MIRPRPLDPWEFVGLVVLWALLVGVTTWLLLDRLVG